MLDANVVLDSLMLEANGQPRSGKMASEQVLVRCDQGELHGLVAWHTLPIVAYYHGRQNAPSATASMMDALLGMLEVPKVGQKEAISWRNHRIADFEVALQMASAVAGMADVFVTRNTSDFVGCALPVMTPGTFLAAFPTPSPGSPTLENPGL